MEVELNTLASNKVKNEITMALCRDEVELENITRASEYLQTHVQNEDVNVIDDNEVDMTITEKSEELTRQYKDIPFIYIVVN